MHTSPQNLAMPLDTSVHNIIDFRLIMMGGRTPRPLASVVSAPGKMHPHKLFTVFRFLRKCHDFEVGGFFDVVLKWMDEFFGLNVCLGVKIVLIVCGWSMV